MKPFKTIEEQIDIIKSRGMTINDEKEVHDYLLFNNYYNVVNGFGKLFEVSTNKFLNGCEFSELKSVYDAERNIKHSVYPPLVTIEGSFKSILSYVFSMNHKEKEAYFNKSNFNTDPSTFSKFREDISKIISKYERLGDNAISHYMAKHDSVPLWVLVNFMTFGQTIVMFKMMNDKDKSNITKYVNYMVNENMSTDTIRLTHKNIYVILDNVRELRNIIAHDNLLLGKKMPNSIIYIPELYGSLSVDKIKTRNTVFDTILAMKMLTSRKQFIWMIKEIGISTKLLKTKLHSISHDKVLYSFGMDQEKLDHIYYDLKQDFTPSLKMV